MGSNVSASVKPLLYSLARESRFNIRLLIHKSVPPDLTRCGFLRGW